MKKSCRMKFAGVDSYLAKSRIAACRALAMYVRIAVPYSSIVGSSRAVGPVSTNVTMASSFFFQKSKVPFQWGSASSSVTRFLGPTRVHPETGSQSVQTRLHRWPVCGVPDTRTCTQTDLATRRLQQYVASMHSVLTMWSKDLDGTLVTVTKNVWTE